MKKIITYTYLFILILSCNKKQTYYHGLILDENQIPISNVTIKENNGLQSTISNKDGYFKLYRNPDIIYNLIFSKKGYQTEKIKTVWSQSGETVEYTFLNIKTDTIVLKQQK